LTVENFTGGQSLNKPISRKAGTFPEISDDTLNSPTTFFSHHSPASSSLWAHKFISMGL